MGGGEAGSDRLWSFIKEIFGVIYLLVLRQGRGNKKSVLLERQSCVVL